MVPFALKILGASEGDGEGERDKHSRPNGKGTLCRDLVLSLEKLDTPQTVQRSNMERKVDVLIIGAGTAGLNAASEVRKTTNNFVVVDPGPLGTTCARVGCMPSKVLVQIANDYHRRHAYECEGIRGGDGLSLDGVDALNHVRALRDRFVSSVLDDPVRALGDRLVNGTAEFVEPTLVKVGTERMRANRIVVATGSRPVVPDFLRPFEDRLLTSDTLFEEDALPARLAVLGLGAIGLELGQALSRCGVSVTGFDTMAEIGGLQDPVVNAAAIDILGAEFPMHLGVEAKVEKGGGSLQIHSGNINVRADKLLVSVGRTPNIEHLHLERLGIPLDEGGIPPFDRGTMQVDGLPVFIAGDVNGHRPVLHEASQEGEIAGHNAVAASVARFRRKSPMAIAFCDPNICVVGSSWDEVRHRHPVVGTARFDSGRALIQQRVHGMISLYADRANGELLGAEMVAPGGEHLAHLLAWSLEYRCSVFELLDRPFYHPTLEETLKTALADAAGKVDAQGQPRELV